MIEINKTHKLPQKVLWYQLFKVITPVVIILFALLLKAEYDDVLGFFSYNYLFLLFVIIVAVVYYILSYVFFSFVVNEKNIVVNSGIVARDSNLIPKEAIQNVKIESGPIMAIFRLEELKIWTSSQEQNKNGQENEPQESIILTAEDAEELRNKLIN